MKTPTSIPHYVELAARALAREPADAETPVPIALPDRAATVRELQRALHSRARKRVTRWLGVATSAVAAAAAIAIFVAWRGAGVDRPDGATLMVAAPPSGLSIAAIEGAGASIETAGIETPAVARVGLRPGSAVRAPREGHVVLALDTGTRLLVGPAARTRIVELGTMQRFDLERGSLEAAVAKLQPGHRFVVGTPDAEVEVKGTRFELTVDGDVSRCDPLVRTHLVVQEGVVAVRHGGSEVRVAAGSTWPACAPPAPEPVVHAGLSQAAQVREPAHARGPRRAAVASNRTPAAAAPAVTTPIDPSTLAEQNDLFAAALAARHRGGRAEAIRWFDRLIARYPTGQLADSARVERRRLIEGRDDATSSD